MGAFFVFFGTLLLSLFVALLAAMQLADYFQASEEFVAVMLAIAVFVAVAMAVFAIAYALARQANVIGWVAICLVIVAIAMVMGPSTVQRFAERSSNPASVGPEGIAIALELLVPALVAILIQWGLVRRRLLQALGEDDLTLWPWVTTVVVGFAVLNPFGLRTLGTALAQSPLTIVEAAVAVAVVMIAIECYIRSRMLRRRHVLEPAAPQA